MDQIDKMLGQSQYWLEFASDWLNNHQIELFISAVMFALALFVSLLFIAAVQLLRRKKEIRKVKPQEINLSPVDRIILDYLGKIKMSFLNDPRVRILPVKMIKKMFGDVIHELLTEATDSRKKIIAEADADRLREFFAFRLGDLELLPPKKPAIPPKADDLKAEIKARRKASNGGKPSPLPDPATIATHSVTAGDSLRQLLKQK